VNLDLTVKHPEIVLKVGAYVSSSFFKEFFYRKNIPKLKCAEVELKLRIYINRNI